MSPKRRNFQPRAKQSALVNRLGRKQRRDPFDRARRWFRVDPTRLSGVEARLGRRAMVAWGFAVALLLGWAIGAPLVAYWQGDGGAVLVRSIAVQGHDRLPASAVAEASGVAPGSTMKDLDRAAIASQVAAHPLVREARVAVLPAGRLVVRVEEREPRALLRGPARERAPSNWWLVDETGTPFANTRADAWSRLPRLRSRSEVRDDTASESLRFAIELARGLDDPRFDALSDREIELPGETGSDGWVIHTRGNPQRVLLGNEAVEPRLERLAMLLEARLPEARTASEIDLRFAGQAVLRSGPASI